MIRERVIRVLRELFESDVIPADLDPAEALFGEESRLGLDSIDALNLIVGMEQEFKVKIEGEKRDLSAIIHSVDTIAAYVEREMVLTLGGEKA